VGQGFRGGGPGRTWGGSKLDHHQRVRLLQKTVPFTDFPKYGTYFGEWNTGEVKSPLQVGSLPDHLVRAIMFQLSWNIIALTSRDGT